MAQVTQKMNKLILPGGGCQEKFPGGLLEVCWRFVRGSLEVCWKLVGGFPAGGLLEVVRRLCNGLLEAALRLR